MADLIPTSPLHHQEGQFVTAADGAGNAPPILFSKITVTFSAFQAAAGVCWEQRCLRSGKLTRRDAFQSQTPSMHASTLHATHTSTCKSKLVPAGQRRRGQRLLVAIPSSGKGSATHLGTGERCQSSASLRRGQHDVDPRPGGIANAVVFLPRIAHGTRRCCLERCGRRGV